MKLSTQIGAALALLLLIVAGLAGWQLVLINRLHQANRQLADVDLEVSRTSLGIRLEIDRLADLTERFFVLRDPAYRAELQRVRGLIEIDLQSLMDLSLDSSVRQSLETLYQRWSSYQERAGEIEAVIPSGREPTDAREELQTVIESLRHDVELMDQAAADRGAASIDESTTQAATARRAAVLVGVVAVLLVGLLALWISRSTIRPLRSLADGAQAIAEGDFDHRVHVRGPLEVQSLADDFNRMAGELAAVDAMKSEFLSSVSHDLKAPLAAMQETTRLMLDDESVDRRRLLQLNLQSAERLQGMIGDILDVARLESGGVEFELEIVDLVDVCRRVIGEAEGLLQAGQLQVEVDWPTQSTLVEADADFLHQAVWNLVSNAIKFSPEGGTVRLVVRTSEPNAPPMAELRVMDEGPGVPDEDKPHVFERFFRSRRHERFASGTGLGLAIARSVVERLGGTIGVEDRDGGGSVFFVLLPIADPQSTATIGSNRRA